MAKETNNADPRQEKWDAFLERARSQRNEHSVKIFDEQKARGEFDKIPDSFN